MTLRKLEIFYCVAEKLNMTTVSKEMYISQPAISQMIKEMEEELGVRLFNRLGKRLYLTDEGELFKTYSRRMMNLYQEFEEVLDEKKDLKKGKLKLGASSTIGIYVMPQLIKEFIRDYPEIDISLKIGNTEDIANMILKNDIDLAFVEAEVDMNEIKSEEIWKDELILITHPEHKWGEHLEIDESELKSEKFILREEGSGTRKVFEAAMKNNHIKYKESFTLGNTEAIKEIIKTGLGISCLSKLTVKKELDEGRLKGYKLKNFEIDREFNLIHHKDKHFSPLMKEFIRKGKEKGI
ncbi:selenium metabolism-associated LysR family transcriptional regulator [uncultured Ilyobacter sp.]|uniref:selenium metabolism-associated LysR family transcriptional regulator n=1 Tax=uncultured Ilyobacter sp. TaxID=544433 RepID=UPI0029F46090|nr:selenium metabolism-associated LysR family transcriptional regulator [uncultured Ilyobacter sp.]